MAMRRPVSKRAPIRGPNRDFVPRLLDLPGLAGNAGLTHTGTTGRRRRRFRRAGHGALRITQDYMARQTQNYQQPMKELMDASQRK